MGKLIRAMDWARIPLGPRKMWPQSLRTAVNLCLASNFPISIAWGPKRVQIYNDGYWPICGAKHPHSMGQDFRECWAAPWPAIGAAFEQARAGLTAFLENQRMHLDRNGSRRGRPGGEEGWRSHSQPRGSDLLWAATASIATVSARGRWRIGLVGCLAYGMAGRLAIDFPAHWTAHIPTFRRRHQRHSLGSPRADTSLEARQGRG